MGHSGLTLLLLLLMSMSFTSGVLREHHVTATWRGSVGRRLVTTSGTDIVASTAAEADTAWYVCTAWGAKVSKCAGVNYNPGTGLCECVSEDALAGLTLEDASGWSYYEAVDVDTTFGKLRLFIHVSWLTCSVT